MKSLKMLKLLILALCLYLVLCLAACKDGMSDCLTSGSANAQQSVQSDKSSTTEASNGADGNETSSSDKASQGIELEEDVFDNSDTQSNLSDNALQNTSEVVSDNVDTDDNQSSETSSDETSSNDTVSEENTSSNDGTVKLPVDWFD